MGNNSFILDGTGGSSEKMVRRMEEARMNGFSIELIYVTVCLNTSLKRNQQRERTVPNEVIFDKFRSVRQSFEIVAPNADEVKVIRNE